MSGLRDELAALADEWAAERYPATGDPGWNQGYDVRRETDIDALTALLDRFPPEAEGGAVDESPSKNGTYCSRRSPDRGVICTRELGHPGWHVGHLSEDGEVSQRWTPDAALAASPEEQDRG